MCHSTALVTQVGSGQHNELVFSKRMFNIHVLEQISTEAQTKTAVENAMAFVVDLIYSNVFLPSYTLDHHPTAPNLQTIPATTLASSCICRVVTGYLRRRQRHRRPTGTSDQKTKLRPSRRS